MARTPEFAAAVAAMSTAKAAVESAAAEVAAAKAELAEAEAQIAAGAEANDAELEARADARAEGLNRPDAPLADLPALEAAAEVARRLIGKLEARHKADSEAFANANQATMNLRAKLAREWVQGAGIGWTTQTSQIGNLPPETRREPTKAAFNPAMTLGQLAALWAGHGIANGGHGPKGTLAGFVAGYLAEPNEAQRETARLEARKAAGIDD